MATMTFSMEAIVTARQSREPLGVLPPRPPLQILPEPCKASIFIFLSFATPNLNNVKKQKVNIVVDVSTFH